MVEDTNDTAATGATAAGGDYPRLNRDDASRVLTGVCGGLGRYTGIDPVVYRVAFGILGFVQGQGILLYIVAALLMPSAPGGTAWAERLLRRRFDAAGVLTILGGLLVASTLSALLGGLDTNAITALVVAALAVATAHARGVRFKAVLRDVPERLAGHRTPPAGHAAPDGGISRAPDAPLGPGGLPPGAIDLATFSTHPAPPATPAPPADHTTPGPPAAPASPGASADPAVHGALGAPAAPAGPAAPGSAAEGRRGWSVLTPVTLLCAGGAGAATIPVAREYPGPDAWTIVMATALGVIGLGLVLGGWFRTRGLATAGTVLSLALVTSSVAADAPDSMKYREVTWRPTADPGTGQDYRVTVGQGALDLTALPLRAGRRVVVRAEVVVGGLAVTVPRDARVVLDARIMLGDLRVDGRTTSGPNARVRRVLEPESATRNPPTIELRLRGKIGDVDVDVDRG